MAIILSYVPDLMFGTRIEDAGKRLGHTVQTIEPGQDPDVVVERCAPALVIVALDAPQWDRTVKAAKSVGARVIAFGSHKNVELMRAAKNAGCDEVMARSRMAAELPALLSRYAGA